LERPLSPKTTRVSIETLGCKLNQAESEEIGRDLAESGCLIVGKDEPADICLVNTCSVTHVADRKSRHSLRLARRRNPDACVVGLGCAVEGGDCGIGRLEGVDLLLDNAGKENVVAVLRQKGLVPAEAFSYQPSRVPGRTRSFLKVQSGCDLFCSYCVVPGARGREISLPPERIVAALQRRELEGYREAVLTGTEVGRYCSQEVGLKSLIEKVLAATDLPRLRISSLQPQEITSELLELWDNRRLCPHFHLSLQSGSDSVLARMRRRYSVVDFRRVIGLVRAQIPQASITTDIIVGFPGETEQEFQESCDLCREIGFSHIHVFPYSRREGTEAAGLPGQLGAKEKNCRTIAMLELAAESQKNTFENSVGQTLPVLFEQGRNSLWWGLSDNYLKVYVRSQEDLSNQILKVAIGGTFRDGLSGEPVGTYSR
jgi:threonylcarbamoyladenosine tRNA methylthiotransferase MtaB